ncbi:potential E3 ubiquitin-protein ligase ariadne-1 [Scaptodrosophila lebanonensis]|uniref:RBR-type E3 ubiquitin transferase n=1 Tax=Drosophila lebanonensis TaxID=7225 RepID=A0A6J2TCJ5_DROLE|nr:potential E3 ubiquitin-protein ligase ariadne-1 [Scaptodrosophila lebanonensis]
MNSDDEYSDQDHGDSRRSLHSHSSFVVCVDSDEDTCTEIDLPERPKRNVEVDDFSYTVLSVDQIMQYQRSIIDEVNNVLNLSPQVTRIILNHYKWDKETLFEKYFERTPEDFFQRAHVLNPFASPSSTSVHQISPKSSKSSHSGGEEEVCGICYCACNELKGLGCGHSFCAECWKQYLANKTFSEGLAHSITCPSTNCDILVDDVSFEQLADNPEVIERYQQLITNTFVECNALMRWCPAPNCSNAIKATYAEPRAVRCKCGHQFCFACGESWHEPASCTWLKKWIKKCHEDSETSNWIAQHTKECPKCNVTIEKDGGCNHMVCKNPSCRYDFCWVCLGSWEPHGSSWYSCNRFDEEEAKQARLAQQRYRSSMARYLHYYNRYKNHMHSMGIEHKLYANVQQKMDDMQEVMSWIEVQFLKDAVDVLCQCRATLMYSYVFAYYLASNNQKIIFEDNQRDMEMATEKISECLEREITVRNLYEIKQKVLDLAHYCQKRRAVLLCHVREGYEKDWWEFIDDS